MRPTKPHHKVGEHRANHVSDDVKEIDRTTTDLHQYESSADLYDQRARFRAKLNKGDWWIGVGLYLMLLSVAFVVF